MARVPNPEIVTETIDNYVFSSMLSLAFQSVLYQLFPEKQIITQPASFRQPLQSPASQGSLVMERSVDLSKQPLPNKFVALSNHIYGQEMQSWIADIHIFFNFVLTSQDYHKNKCNL